jgi:cytochrome c peroxidase
VTSLLEALYPGFALRHIIALPLLLLGVGCADHDSSAAPPTADAPLTAAVAPDGFPMGSVTQTAPPDNQLTEPRAQLGRRLFYETNLSRTRDVSCGTCHRQDHGFADPDAVSPGVDGRLGTRNASALSNLAWSGRFFWDGRAASLEEQAGKPIENPLEMDLPLAEAVSRLEADETYAAAFLDAYDEQISADNLQRALASFVRVLVSGQSPYDRHLAGDDHDFTAAAQRGEQLFFSERAECFHCHPQGALTNDGLFNNGSYREGGDEGRKEITGRPGDLGKFKVPGLRNVAVSAPYMHDGSVATLRGVVEQYAAGGLGHSSTDPQITPLQLNPDEVDDLIAFLEALTDQSFLGDPRFGPPTQ